MLLPSRSARSRKSTFLRRPNRVWPYAIAVIAVGLATLVKLAAPNWFSADAQMLFLAAVLVAIWRGGAGAGAIAVALSAVSQAVFFLPIANSAAAMDRSKLFEIVVWSLETFALCGLWSALDASKRRAAEAQRDEEMLRAVFAASPVPMYLVDSTTHRVLAANEGALELYGYTWEAFVGRTTDDLKLSSTFSDLPGGEAGTVGPPIRHVRRDGSVVDLAQAWRALTYEGGPAVVVAVKDVTERARLEQQLRHAQKMEAIGRLAGGVAHDFNNILNVLLGYSAMLLEEVPQEGEVYEALSEMKLAGERAASLTRQLLAFSRRQPQTKQLVNINEVLSSTAKFMQRIVGSDVQIAIDLGHGLGRVLADPSQIEQIVMNLAVNARDAMPAGGRLTLETSSIECGEAHARTHPETVPGRYVRLAVSDTGVGMDDETQSQIFEPFFTTKAQGKGTGLGLSMVFGTVQQYGGHIEVSSELGVGTRFEIFLPVGESACASLEPPQSLPRGASGSETILLVDDEEQVLNLAHKALRRHGYHVLTAHHPGEALLVSEQHSGQIDLLVTDVVMPRMNGRELADRLLERRPAMKILYTSGYTDSVVLDCGSADLAGFLQKPATPSMLTRKVRAVLDSVPVPGGVQ